MSEKPRYLQSYVVPLCEFRRDGAHSIPVRLCGTAFFIDNDGSFLTAAHVLRDAFARWGSGRVGFVGLCCKAEDGSPNSIAAPIIDWVAAPAPFDIAAGRVPLVTATYLSLEPIEVTLWKQVATLGYAEAATSPMGRGVFMGLRGKRGYVQRVIEPDEALFGPRPRCYELDFVVEPGLSGAPLFVHQGLRQDTIVGVCTGSNRSRLIDFEFEEIDASGQVCREVRTRIEEVGIAEVIDGLRGWDRLTRAIGS